MEIHLGGVITARQVTKVCFYLISSLTSVHSSTYYNLTSVCHLTQVYQWQLIIKSQWLLCRPLCFGLYFTQSTTFIYLLDTLFWILTSEMLIFLVFLHFSVPFNTFHPFHFYLNLVTWFQMLLHLMQMLLHFIISLSNSISYHWCCLY